MDDDKGRLTMELFSTEVNGKDWHIACLQKLDTTSWDCQWTANDHANKDSNYFQHAKMDLIITEHIWCCVHHYGIILQSLQKDIIV